MNEKKLYTAVGRFIYRHNSEGERFPVLFLGNREYLVDPQEFMIWVNLNWRICRWEEIGKHYDESAQQASYYNPRTWEACTNRLLTRGLLVCGCGDTEYDALYDLLSSMYIIPAMGRISLRLFTISKLVLTGKVRLAAATKLLRLFHHTPREKQILRLVSRAMMSTAELIGCLEKQVYHIRNENTLMDTVYEDSDITSDNIGQVMKGCLCCRETISAIANLYLSQQLIFERV